MRKTTATFGAALAFASIGQAQAAQTRQCVSLNELKGFTGYLLPSILEATMRECQPHLTAEGYLQNRGPALLERLNVGKDEDWPMARKAFAKIGGVSDKEDGEFKDVPDALLRPMVEIGMTGELIGKLSPTTCVDVERVIATLDPMPRSNIVSLVAVVFNMATRKDKDMPGCPAG